MFCSKAVTAISLFICIQAIGLRAQAPASSESDDLLALLNTPVSSASKRAERTIEAPSVISVITRDQFQAYGWLSMNDALYSLPGFAPSQDFDRLTVSSRGLYEGWNNNHILHLVDGIPFNDNIYGSAYTSEITPVFMVKTLEVLRGPGSALYGSNATNGVVQMKTLSAQDLAGGGEAQIRTGTHGERIYDFAVGHSSELVSAVVGFNAYATDGNSYLGLDGSLRVGADGKPLKVWIDDARNSQYTWVKLEGEGALKGWTFQFHQQAWDFKTGHGWLWAAPDFGEKLDEKRQILALSYAGELGANWTQEFMLRYQRKDLYWSPRLYPNGTAGFPEGVNETLNTKGEDLFGRAQWSVALPEDANFLFGLEGTRFSYNGDNIHTSNVDLNTVGGTGQPFPGNATLPLGPWLEYLKDKPLVNTGMFGQFTSGKLLGDQLKLVLGGRYDKTSLDYTRITEPGQPAGSKSYSQVSPRVALVYAVLPTLAIKAMTGKAFRSPAPSELAGANTDTLSSNIQNLKPETLTTSELAVDWIATPNLNWRTNVFRTTFSNEIAYSATGVSLSKNLYSLTTQGLETELLFGFSGVRGYLNYSYAKRVDETILDPAIAASPDALTWAPGSSFKGGVILTQGRWTEALNGLYQGQVSRRSSDFAPGVTDTRPATLESWFTLGAKVTYVFNPRFSLSAVGSNLLDTDKNVLIKSTAQPFDYQGQGRRLAVVMKATF